MSKIKSRRPVRINASVRQLVWKKSQTEQEKYHKILKWTAETPWGEYTIRRFWADGYILGLKLDLKEIFFGGSYHLTLLDAKLDAQTDFNQRVMDCFTNRQT